MTREEQIDNAAVIARPFGNSIEHCCWRDGFRKGAEWADANRWVRIEDGVPDKETFVLVYRHNTTISFYYYGEQNSGAIGWFYDGEEVTKQHITPTHWMPLPEPPKAEQ